MALWPINKLYGPLHGRGMNLNVKTHCIILGEHWYIAHTNQFVLLTSPGHLTPCSIPIVGNWTI
jgi:hypothetical protein